MKTSPGIEALVPGLSLLSAVLMYLSEQVQLLHPWEPEGTWRGEVLAQQMPPGHREGQQRLPSSLLSSLCFCWDSSSYQFPAHFPAGRGSRLSPQPRGLGPRTPWPGFACCSEPCSQRSLQQYGQNFLASDPCSSVAPRLPWLLPVPLPKGLVGQVWVLTAALAVILGLQPPLDSVTAAGHPT